MADTKDEPKTDVQNHGAFGSEPPAEKDALKRYTDRDQLQPQGKPPTGSRPTIPDAVERPDARDRDTPQDDHN